MNDSISLPNRVHRLFCINPKHHSAEPVWTSAGSLVARADLAAERRAFAVAVRLHPSTLREAR